MQLEPEVTEATEGCLVAGADLYRAVISVERAAAKDSSRPALAGIQVGFSPGRVEFIGVDGFRISHAGIAVEGDVHDGKRVLFRKDQLLQAARLMRRVKHIALEPMDDGSCWLFRAPGIGLVTAVSVIDVVFPDWRQVINGLVGDSPEFIVSLNPRFLADAAATASPDMQLQLLRKPGGTTSQPIVVRIQQARGEATVVESEHIIMPFVIGAH